jgi:hypothetical protein
MLMVTKRAAALLKAAKAAEGAADDAGNPDSKRRDGQRI